MIEQGGLINNKLTGQHPIISLVKISFSAQKKTEIHRG
jgi:hypothetical protein